jgi:hypothetical protein
MKMFRARDNNWSKGSGRLRTRFSITKTQCWNTRSQASELLPTEY